MVGLVADEDPDAPDINTAIRLALEDTEAHGRLLLTQDPTLRTLTHGPVNRSSLVNPGEWWPVALVELVNYRALGLNGEVFLLAEEIARKLGLGYAQPGRIPETADNWSFRDGPRCELLDPTGTLLAGFAHATDPQWRDAAHAHGQVLVLYGGRLGVRKPGGVTAAGYDVHARDAELHAALAAGTVLAASIAYTQR